MRSRINSDGKTLHTLTRDARLNIVARGNNGAKKFATQDAATWEETRSLVGVAIGVATGRSRQKIDKYHLLNWWRGKYHSAT